MGNLAYVRAFSKQQKTSYANLTEPQKRYIKAKEQYEQADKYLSWFYSNCKRTETGAVDFESMTDSELDTFEQVNKNKEKAVRVMSKLEDQIDVEYTLSVFLQTNTHSMSF